MKTLRLNEYGYPCGNRWTIFWPNDGGGKRLTVVTALAPHARAVVEIDEQAIWSRQTLAFFLRSARLEAARFKRQNSATR